MSSMKIEESFEAKASKKRVYDFIRDPEQCFPCLPGATFGQMHPDGRFDGKISVAVGPVKVSYDGWATYEDEDFDAGRLKLKGEGREKNGSGLVTLEMVCTVTETDGVTRVEVDADVGLAGRIIRFGRGLVQSIASEVFQEFTTRARARLESSPTEAPAAAPAADPFGGGAADPFGGAPAADPFGAPTPEAAAPADPFAAAPEPAPAPAPAPAPPAAPQPPAPQEDNAPANGLALLFRALGSMIGGFFRRLFGGSS